MKLQKAATVDWLTVEIYLAGGYCPWVQVEERFSGLADPMHPQRQLQAVGDVEFGENRA